jgi:hypothetical protein
MLHPESLFHHKICAYQSNTPYNRLHHGTYSMRDTHSEGFSWCSDCEEILCNGCDKAHRILKLTLSHHLVPLAEIPEVPNFIPEIQQCDAHPDHIYLFSLKFILIVKLDRKEGALVFNFQLMRE